MLHFGGMLMQNKSSRNKAHKRAKKFAFIKNYLMLTFGNLFHYRAPKYYLEQILQ